MRFPATRLLSCLAALILAAGCGRGGAPGSDKSGLTETSSRENQVERVLLYPSEEGEHMTAVTVFLPSSGNRLRNMEELAKRYVEGEAGEGQVQPFPANCHLRAFFLLGESEVVLDLSGPVNSGGGSAREVGRVYGLIDTLCWNFEEIKSVRILVNGEERETLLGHLDISSALAPEWDLVDPTLRATAKEDPRVQP